MKTYAVVFDPHAQEEALEAAAYIALHSPTNAAKWYAGLVKAIKSLDILPTRCAVAPEAHFLGEELHHYIYKSHRLIFRVEEKTKTVRVLHVRHGAMQPLGKEVQEETDDQKSEQIEMRSTTSLDQRVPLRYDDAFSHAISPR